MWTKYDSKGNPILAARTLQSIGDFNVLDFGAKGDSTTDDTTAVAAAMVAAAGGGSVYFPPGGYIVASTVVLPGNCTVYGSNKGKSVIISKSTFTTGDVFQCQSGLSNTCIRDLWFTSQAATARTSGATINVNGCHDVRIENCNIYYPYVGIAIQGNAFKTFVDHVDIKVPTAMTTAANSAGVLVNNGGTGDTYISYMNIESAGGAGKCAYGVRIITTGYVQMEDVACTAMDIGLMVNPAALNEVAINLFLSKCLFDTCVTTGATFSTALASNKIRQARFTDCWFSGTSAGPGILFTLTAGVQDDIAFLGCRILSNNTHGITMAGTSTVLTNLQVSQCTIAGNSTAGAGTYHGINMLAAVGGFNIQNNNIGAVDTFASNQGYAVLIPAGTITLSYIVAGNVCRGNVTGAVSDLATLSSTAVQRIVTDNLAGLPGGAIQTLAAAVATSGTGETLIMAARVQKNSVKIGDTFEIECHGISSSTGTLIFRVKVGANGTTADTQCWISITSAAQVANQRAGFRGLLVIRSLTTVQCECVGYAQAALLPTLVAAVGTPAITSTADWFIDITCTCSVGTWTCQSAVVAPR